MNISISKIMYKQAVIGKRPKCITFWQCSWWIHYMDVKCIQQFATNHYYKWRGILRALISLTSSLADLYAVCFILFICHFNISMENSNALKKIEYRLVCYVFFVDSCPRISSLRIRVVLVTILRDVVWSFFAVLSWGVQ